MYILLLIRRCKRLWLVAEPNAAEADLAALFTHGRRLIEDRQGLIGLDHGFLVQDANNMLFILAGPTDKDDRVGCTLDSLRAGPDLYRIEENGLPVLVDRFGWRCHNHLLMGVCRVPE